jgi:hypothetical protein
MRSCREGIEIMTEHDSGVGRLVSLEADQNEYSVDYKLSVDTRVTGSSERYDPPKVGKHYSLVVKQHGDDKIRDGEYTLKTNNEILRLRKVGSRWVVVQP